MGQHPDHIDKLNTPVAIFSLSFSLCVSKKSKEKLEHRTRDHVHVTQDTVLCRVVLELYIYTRILSY